MADFITEIKGYFTANITPRELAGFEEKFSEFKKIWTLYYPQNSAKQLDKYADILKEYHKNNLKRDAIFAKEITKINGEKIKVVITGGFHSAAME